MKITVDWELLDKMRYNMKVKKLHKKMADCMLPEDMEDSIESTNRILYLLPDNLKEQLIDKLIKAIDETGDKYEF